MPIRGLTDRGATFPEIGRIRKGAPKEKDRWGEDLTYFRVVFDEHETAAAERFAEAYDEHPRSLNVWLPFDRIDEVWDAWVEAYVAGGLVHRSDGKYVWYHVDPITGERKIINGYDVNGNHNIPCPSAFGKPVAKYLGKGGKEKELMAAPVGRLMVIIPELNRFAYLTLVTTSQYDIGNISSQLMAIRQVAGRLTGVPFLLQRKPKMVSVPMNEGKKQRMEKWLISIEIHPEWADAKMRSLAAHALPQTPEIVEGYLIEPPGTDSEQDGEWEPGFEPPTQPHPPIDQEMSQVPLGSFGEGTQGTTEPTAESGDRPYQPEKVREKLQQWIEHYKGTRKDEARGKMELWQYARWQLAECFAGDPGTDAKAHTVSAFLTGKDSSKKWTGAEARAIEKWLDPKTVYPSEDLKPSRMAVKEAQLIVRARMMELGQQALLDGMGDEEE